MRSTLFLSSALCLAFALTGCDAGPSDTPSAPALRGPIALAADAAPAASSARRAAREGEVEADVDVEIVTADGSLFVSEAAYEIEAEDGEIESFFRGRDIFDGQVIDEYTVDVTCVAFEADGRSARLGGVFTSGTYEGFGAVATVVDGDDGPDAGVGPFAAYPETVAFHCETGISREVLLNVVSSFGTCEVASGLCAITRGDIEVEADGDDDGDDD